jgi:hypothetical protein
MQYLVRLVAPDEDEDGGETAAIHNPLPRTRPPDQVQMLRILLLQLLNPSTMAITQGFLTIPFIDFFKLSGHCWEDANSPMTMLS